MDQSQGLHGSRGRPPRRGSHRGRGSQRVRSQSREGRSLASAMNQQRRGHGGRGHLPKGGSHRGQEGQGLNNRARSQSREDRGETVHTRGRGRGHGAASGARRGPRGIEGLRPLSYKTFEDLANSESYEALEKLNFYSDRVELLLKEREIRFDLFLQCVLAIAKACESSSAPGGIHQLLITIHKHDILTRHIARHLQTCSRSETRAPEFIGSVVTIMNAFMVHLPSSYGDVGVAITCLDQAVTTMRQRDINLTPILQRSIIEMREYSANIEEIERQKKKKRDLVRIPGSAQEAEPPDDFREIPIFPSAEELFEDFKPFLRANVINGGYRDVNHYLDVQFRLLREDFVQPLRNGISEYRSFYLSGNYKKNTRSENLRLYNEVRVIAMKPTDGGIVNVIKFSVANMKRVKWERSKRLLHGSLVCLSEDNFSSVMFGVIENRDVEKLKEGIIEVKLNLDPEHAQNIFSKQFLMAESSGYFEAYRYVLSRLQEVGTSSFPLQRYIVNAEKNPNAPIYLLDDSHYKISNVLKLRFPLRECDILTSNWPSDEKFVFDKSQLDAYKSALTQDLTLIQGPPGTGKTYVGLKIVETLLENKDIWRVNGGCPILLLCYTNHALDQFLEGVLEFEDKLVRIGGRSSNERIKELNLSALRQKRIRAKERPKHRFLRLKELRLSLEISAKSIQRVEKMMGISQKRILSFDELRKHMEGHHDVSFALHNTDLYNKDRKNLIKIWLGVSDIEVAIAQEQKHINYLSDLEFPVAQSLFDAGGMLVHLFDFIRRHTFINPLLIDLKNTSYNHEVVANITDVWGVNPLGRWLLYKFWLQELYKHIQQQVEEYDQALKGTGNLLLELQESHLPFQVQKDMLRKAKAMREGLKQHAKHIESLEDDLAATNHKVLSLRKLSKVIAPCHQESLIKNIGPFQDTDYVLGLWLEIPKKFVLAEKEDAEPEIKDEADYAAEERYLEDDDHESGFLVNEDKDDDKDGFSSDEEDYEVEEKQPPIAQKERFTSKRDIQRRIMSDETLDIEEVFRIRNVWSISEVKRWNLYRYWLQEYRRELMKKLRPLHEQYELNLKQLQEVRSEEDVEIISDALVVGVTTTGAAKYHHLLQRARSKIVVIEEAAEVLEAHIVTSLTPECEHLILIGDHQQLRPNPTVYQLATKFKLDISLFERLINNGFEHHQLVLQHRMRPEISRLLKLHKDFYPQLRDHESVLNYPNVHGVEKNMFFLDHDKEETSEMDNRSKSNLFEAQFITRFCKYLLQQGYKGEQVTILTTYTGQLWNFKKTMQEDREFFKSVRVCPVDNYQGEENDIIVLSFVRSNTEGNIGFLKVANRVCVALSRAKRGMYCVGNFTLLAKQNQLWQVIVKDLEANGNLGKSINLMCRQHPGTITPVSTPGDFQKVPAGGCDKVCAFQLSCGHTCVRVCHTDDRSHEQYQCFEPCMRIICLEGHMCPLKCCQRCPEQCRERVKRVLKCGHEKTMMCHQDKNTIQCKEMVYKVLPCNHETMLMCYINVDQHKCQTKVKKELPCGHQQDVICHKDIHSVNCITEVERILSCLHTMKMLCYEDPKEKKCKAPCMKTLECGHPCKEKCSHDCTQNCLVKVVKLLPCEHRQKVSCFEDPEKVKCKAQCERQLECGHVCGNKCFMKCTTKCAVKVEKILPCGHVKLLPCHEDPEKHNCHQECLKLLECGHKCTNKCNEPCSVCKERVEKKLPACEHTVIAECSRSVEKIVCRQPCVRKLDCGHPCTRRCGEACTIKCKTIIKKIFEPCSHEEEVECHQKKCPADCKKILVCGHKCGGNCGDCRNGRLHVSCQAKCSRKLLCGHRCPKSCSEPCPPCTNKCNQLCKHQKCKKRCKDVCEDCESSCTAECEHVDCDKLCFELCERPPCDKPCGKMLKCEHRCIGLCGEECPVICRTCNADDDVFKQDGDDNERFIQLQKCKHVFTVKELDEYVRRSMTAAIHVFKPLECPTCQIPIIACDRYKNQLAKQRQYLATIKTKQAEVNQADRDMVKTSLKTMMVLTREVPQYSTSGSDVDAGLQVTKYVTRRFVEQLNDFLTLAESAQDIETNKIKIQMIRRLVDIELKVQKLKDAEKSRELLHEITWIGEWVLRNVKIGLQQMSDFRYEVIRLILLTEVTLQNSSDKLTVIRLRSLERSVSDGQPFDEEKLSNLSRIIEACIPQQAKVNSLNHFKTRQCDFGIGTWWICNKNHVFAQSLSTKKEERKVCDECISQLLNIRTL